jgi:endonuclease YncB( thermonuclease family)
MKNARSMKKGLFAHDNPMTPWDWRQQNKNKLDEY